MSRITLDLLRKRSEHNEGEISTLEEIALHQENIEKIELIADTCKRLKILLLQHNLVSKIENLSKLKSLEYLNLALNNIETIENLEGLESLRKLDLTVNFIGDLRGLKSLRCNEHLEQLFLTGNPCTDYQRYREYTIVVLPQLKELDGVPISRSERIKALQVYGRIEGEIVGSSARHEKTRKAEILGGSEQRQRDEEEQLAEENDQEDEAFWNRTSRHTPEERVAIAERFLRKQRRQSREKDGGNNGQRVASKPKLFNPEGRPYNVNQPKVSFTLNEERYNDRIVLEVALYKHLDTCYVEVDVQPDYARVTIKGKVLQLTLPCEVSVNDSVAQRNVTNGSLLVTMPRLNPIPTIIPSNKYPGSGGNRKGAVAAAATATTTTTTTATTTEITKRSMTSVREYLEIGPVANSIDLFRIVERKESNSAARHENENENENDHDDSQVPPLERGAR